MSLRPTHTQSGFMCALAGSFMVSLSSELDHGLSEPQIRCIARQLFEALDFLHASHCIHRDLKAGNILLCPDGSIRLGMWVIYLCDP